MRTNYVLIDFENVRPESLEQLEHDHFKLLVFVGASQTKLPIDVVQSMQPLGTRGEYIQISGNGPNALDFHIAYYIGRLAAEDPMAYFHIVSKDKGFDPLVEHLKSKNVLAGRVKSIADIPLVKASNSKSPERLEVVLARLRQPKASKPGTVKKLGNTIAVLFQKKLTEEEVTAIVRNLEKHGHISIADTKVTYALPSDGNLP